MADPNDIGQYVQPQQPGQSWSALLSDPVTRSAMLSAGLQLMTGGWGNGTQQLAAGLGAGAAGAAGTAASLQQQAVNNRDFQAKQENEVANRASKEREAALNRSSRQDISHYVADLRLQGVQERVAGMLERSRMIHGPQTDPEFKFYQAQLQEARKTIEGSVKDLNLSAQDREQMIIARAKERLDEARRQGIFGAGGANAAPGTSTGTATGTGQGGQAATGNGVSAPAKKGEPRQLSWGEVKSTPGFEAALRDPVAREQLKLKYPYLVPQINAYAGSGTNEDRTLRGYNIAP